MRLVRQRIRRPNHGRSERQAIPRGPASGERELAPSDQQRRAPEAEDSARHMMRLESRSCDEEWTEKDDEQRPEIVDEIGFDSGRQPQAEKETEVVGKEPVNTEHVDANRYASKSKVASSAQTTQQEGASDEQKRRNVAKPQAQRRERAPKQNRTERLQRRVTFA